MDKKFGLNRRGVGALFSHENQKVGQIAVGGEASLVLDIGAKMIRFGLAGESSPRFKLDHPDVLWDIAVLDWGSQAGGVEDRLEQILRRTLDRRSLLDPKSREVIILEHLLMPTKLKHLIARIVFTHFQSPIATFINSSVAAMVGVRMRSGLIVDIGWFETSVVPVYDLTPLAPFAVSTRVAMSALFARLEQLLLLHAQPKLRGLKSSDVEDFLYRGIVCSSELKQIPRQDAVWLVDDLERVYASRSSGTVEWTVPSSKNSVKVPTWIRTCVPELLFEANSRYADLDIRSLPLVIEACRKALPIDVRSQLGTILVTGGGAEIPGIHDRLRTATGLTIAQNVYGADIHWIGASLLGYLRIPGIYQVSRDAFNAGSGAPDWSKPL